MKFKLTFFLLLIFSCSVSAQKMDLISRDLSVFISRIPYPPSLKAMRISTATTLKLSVKNGTITDLSLSESADSLYQKAFDLAKSKFNTSEIEKDLKISQITKADILVPIYVSVSGKNDLISFRDNQFYKMNRFSGNGFMGEAIILPIINLGITIIEDHR